MIKTLHRLSAALSLFILVSVFPASLVPAEAAPAAIASMSAIRGTELVAIGFSPGNAESLILDVINGAKKEIRLAAYTFTSRSIANALLRAKQRGVNIAVVLDAPKPSAAPFILPFLKKNNISHRLISKYGIMHNKFLVVDGVIVQTGSYNYTKAAATHNAENILVLRGTGCANVYLKEWTRLWNDAGN